MVLSFNTKIFIIYIVVSEFKIKMMDFLVKIIILIKYLNYINIVLFEFIVKFLEHNNNYYTIKLKKGKKPFYSSIYSL